MSWCDQTIKLREGSWSSRLKSNFVKMLRVGEHEVWDVVLLLKLIRVWAPKNLWWRKERKSLVYMCCKLLLCPRNLEGANISSFLEGDSVWYKEKCYMVGEFCKLGEHRFFSAPRRKYDSLSSPVFFVHNILKRSFQICLFCFIGSWASLLS